MSLLQFHKVFKDESPSRTLTMVIKNYFNLNGLSRRIIRQESVYDSFTEEITKAQYYIKGPMGKGLDIQPSGVHIAFTAGTGILPFMDLVAFLIRYNLNEAEGNLNGSPD